MVLPGKMPPVQRFLFGKGSAVPEGRAGLSVGCAEWVLPPKMPQLCYGASRVQPHSELQGQELPDTEGCSQGWKDPNFPCEHAAPSLVLRAEDIS